MKSRRAVEPCAAAAQDSSGKCSRTFSVEEVDAFLDVDVVAAKSGREDPSPLLLREVRGVVSTMDSALGRRP